MLALILDPLNLMGGAAAVSAIAGGGKVVAMRISKNKRDGLQTELKKQVAVYASLGKDINKLESKIDAVKNTFMTTFPRLDFDSHYYNSIFPLAQEGLRNFLMILNEVDALPSKTKISVLENYLQILDNLSSTITSRIELAKENVDAMEKQISLNLEIRNKTEDRAEQGWSILRLYESTVDKMKDEYDPLFIEKVPSVMRSMKIEIDKYMKLVARLNDEFVYKDFHDKEKKLYNNVYRACEKATVEINYVLRFNEVVFDMTAQRRKVLNRMVVKTPQEKEFYDIALESLAKAEMHAYKSGNPLKEFAKITKPFYVVASELKLLRYSDGILF